MSDHPSLLRLSDRDGRCVYVNRAWQDLTGLPREAALGAGWLEAVHADDSAACQAMVSDSVSSATAFTLSYRLRLASGKYCWLVEQGSPLFGPRGAHCGHSAVGQPAAPPSGAQPTSSAGAPDLIPGTIVAAATHDLMQPLRASELMLGRLATGCADGRERDLVRRLQIALESMRGMIAGLEEWGRGFRHEYCYLGDIATRAGLLHEPMAAAKGLRLQIFAQALPVVSNAVKLERIVNNLLDNAIKYTGCGGRIILAVRPAGHEARLQVWDSGIGISAAQLSGAFGMFSRLAGEETPGSGLGLYTVRRLCDMLGHELTVRSHPGCGSLFEVRLPRADTYLGTGGLPPLHELYFQE